MYFAVFSLGLFVVGGVCVCDRTPLGGKVPMVNGKEIDLYTLYEEVKRAGGYSVMLQKKMWKALAHSVFGVPASSTNAGYTLRMLYQRTLLPYELKYRVTSSDIADAAALGAVHPALLHAPPRPGAAAPTAPDSSAGTGAACEPFGAAGSTGAVSSLVQTLGATRVIIPGVGGAGAALRHHAHAQRHGATSQQQQQQAQQQQSQQQQEQQQQALRDGRRRALTPKQRLTTFHRTLVPTQQNTRMTYRHYFEVSALRLYAALQSGIELQTAWALRTLLVKSFNGEFALEHAPGVLPLLLTRVAHFRPCSADATDPGAPEAQGGQGAPEAKRPRHTAAGGEDDDSEIDSEVDETLDDLFASGNARAMVLVTLLNLSHLIPNARHMAASALLVEYAYHGLCTALTRTGDHCELVAGGTESWRLHLDMMCSVAPWVQLAGTVTVLPACVRDGLLRLLVGPAYLFSDDDATVCAAARVLAQLVLGPGNEAAFRALLERGTGADGTPLVATVPRRIAHIFVMGSAVQQQSALTLLDRLARMSPAFSAAVAQEPLIIRRLVAVVIEVAGMSPTVEQLAVFQEVVERGKAAAAVLRCIILNGAPSDVQYMFAYESFFACLAASDSPLAQNASTVIAALVTVSDSVES